MGPGADKEAGFGRSHQDPTLSLVELEWAEQTGALGHQLVSSGTREGAQLSQGHPAGPGPVDFHSDRLPSTDFPSHLEPRQAPPRSSQAPSSGSPSGNGVMPTRLPLGFLLKLSFLNCDRRIISVPSGTGGGPRCGNVHKALRTMLIQNERCSHVHSLFSFTDAMTWH